MEPLLSLDLCRLRNARSAPINFSHKNSESRTAVRFKSLSENAHRQLTGTRIPLCLPTRQYAGKNSTKERQDQIKRLTRALFTDDRFENFI